MALLPWRSYPLLSLYYPLIMRTRYLICYDVADPKRLRRVARVCESYGTRLQLSVFECFLDGLTLQKLKTRLADVLHLTDDQVLFLPLGPERSPTPPVLDVLGRPPPDRSRVTII